MRGNMRVTWYGTATVLVEAEGERILFDPFVQLKGGEHPNTIDDFLGEENIFVTQGNFDHLLFVPEFLEEGKSTVYCTKTPAETLGKYVEDTSNVVQIYPGSHIRIGKVKINVIKGSCRKHDKTKIFRLPFDKRFFGNLRNVWFLAQAYKEFTENGEAVVYQLEAEGKKVLVLGSMKLDENITYPQGADLLILPFEGRESQVKQAIDIVSRLRPKRVFLDHFDDAYPPVSNRVDTRPLKRMMDAAFPAIRVVKPSVGKPVEF